eukprot:g899.t1
MTSSSRTPLKQIEQLGWFCVQCERECIPIRSESRCICGHRYKVHQENKCTNKSCSCSSFFYIVAEGSWVLKCRCKHKHTDHDPNTHQCKKPGCKCEKFFSPWVCNCNHPWSDHHQRLITKEASTPNTTSNVLVFQVVDLSALVETNGAATATPNQDTRNEVVVDKDIGWEVKSVEDGSDKSVLSLWTGAAESKCLLVFLTHWADLGSWEYAQRLSKVLDDITSQGVEVHCIGLGGVGSGRAFSEYTGLPTRVLYADPAGACCEALGYQRGFGPDLEISPYFKLFPMLLGIDSEGTIPEVLRGYIGDRTAKPVFEDSSLFDILGRGYQRPFELATLRLNNMMKILPNWSELCPTDTRLLTQQGGTIIFKGQDVVYEHKDSGILMTPNLEDVLKNI